MKRSMTLRIAALGLAVGLVGCAQPTKPLYHWEGYQRQVYEHFKRDKTGPEEQLRQLQAQAEKARGSGAALPPGFRAHMGLLLAEMGRTDEAREHFEAEKLAFPESTPYMDFVLGSMKPAAKSSS